MRAAAALDPLHRRRPRPERAGQGAPRPCRFQPRRDAGAACGRPPGSLPPVELVHGDAGEAAPPDRSTRPARRWARPGSPRFLARAAIIRSAFSTASPGSTALGASVLFGQPQQAETPEIASPLRVPRRLRGFRGPDARSLSLYSFSLEGSGRRSNAISRWTARGARCRPRSAALSWAAGRGESRGQRWREYVFWLRHAPFWRQHRRQARMGAAGWRKASIGRRWESSARSTASAGPGASARGRE